MKTALLVLAGLSWFHLPGRAAALDENRLLWVIGQLENGNPKKPGGKYNITQRVWDQHYPTLAYQLSATPEWADACAKKHLPWLAKQLARSGHKATPGNLYLGWLFGATGSLREMKTAAGKEIAQRAENLYEAKSAK